MSLILLQDTDGLEGYLGTALLKGVGLLFEEASLGCARIMGCPTCHRYTTYLDSALI